MSIYPLDVHPSVRLISIYRYLSIR